MGQSPHFMIGLIDLFFYIEDKILQWTRSIAKVLFSAFQGEVDAGQGLPGLVVQFPGNTPPFRFL